jgi:FMN phosphatase YigB (HAD superfamily)
MNKQIQAIFFTALCFLAPCNSAAKTIFVFDIHGVLLAEDLGSLVKKRIAALQQTTRSIKNTQYFEQLCALMKLHQPLGAPTSSYSSELYRVPFEVFALFSGLYNPDSVYTALRAMLATAKLDDQTLMILTALVDSIFQHHERISALTPIPSGVALLHACHAQPDSEVYIYTNAPAEWITQYKKLFPDIFGAIDDSHIFSSGATGILKPSPDVFTFLATAAHCAISDITYIDDSADNCLAANTAGATALLFSAPQLTQLGSDVSSKSTTTEKTQE